MAEREPGTFGVWLGSQLARKQWTQAEFARRASASTGAVSQWINGTRIPDPKSADRIADVLGADLDTVLALAGHRQYMGESDPDDRAAAIAARLRRLKLTDDEYTTFEDFIALFERQIKASRRR